MCIRDWSHQEVLKCSSVSAQELPAEHKRHRSSWVQVALACNPSYSGGRDQEDCGLKPPQANSSRDPISKIPNIKTGWQSGSSFRAPA
jgi:hypothetical protein